MGSASPSDPGCRTAFAGFSEHFRHNPRIFSLEYRLAGAEPFKAQNPFPATLLDAVAGYRYLVQDIGFQPQDILLSGDSAGGHLAFTLARYLATYELPGLLNAGGLLLLSPTVDWANTHNGPDSSMVRHSRTDFVGPIFTTGYTERALRGALPADTTAIIAWISLGSLRAQVTPGMFARLPRACIVAGGAEMTLDAMVTLKERMEADMGTEAVQFMEVPNCTHDFLTMGWHEPERTSTLEEVAKWVGTIWSSA